MSYESNSYKEITEYQWNEKMPKKWTCVKLGWNQSCHSRGADWTNFVTDRY